MGIAGADTLRASGSLATLTAEGPKVPMMHNRKI